MAKSVPQLEGLLFLARRLVDGLYAGRHASPTPGLAGAGQDYYDYRAYVPGDDPAHVDWKLAGRTDRYYVRRYRRETNLEAHLLLDVSASMDFAGLGERSDPLTGKLHYARLLAAAIAYLIHRQGDRAGLMTCAADVVSHLPPGGTYSHLVQLIDQLDSVAAVPGAGSLARGLRSLHTAMPRRGLVIVISDLLDDPPPLLDSLDRLRHDRMEVVVFQILHPDELDPPVDAAVWRLIDPESGSVCHTDLTSLAGDYRHRVHQHVTDLRRALAARAIDHHLVTTTTPVVTALREYLVARTARG